jgi:hypothetical protein
MTSEAEIIIAFLFKRSGKNELKEAEIYLPLSIDLGWFSNRESHEFINHVLTQKLLIKKDGLLIPNFDIEKINIPLRFYPSKKTFAKEEKIVEEYNVMDTIVNRIAEKKNQEYKKIIGEIEKISSEKNVLLEIAALLYAKECDIDIEDIFEFVENKILRENEG